MSSESESGTLSESFSDFDEEQAKKKIAKTTKNHLKKVGIFPSDNKIAKKDEFSLIFIQFKSNAQLSARPFAATENLPFAG